MQPLQKQIKKDENMFISRNICISRNCRNNITLLYVNFILKCFLEFSLKQQTGL